MIPHKTILTGVEARDRVLNGANFLANSVVRTLGPFGLNALLEKGNRITNDGVTISREVSGFMKEGPEKRGAVILHEAAAKTNDEAGDGTTSAITLAQAILKECIKFLPSSKVFVGKKTPSEIIQTIEKEKKEVVKKLIEKATSVKTKEELIEVAKVSVEDEELGELIGESQWKLGKDGVLIAEDTAERKCSVEFIKGIRIDNGFGTSIAINNVEKQSLEVSNVHTILTNQTLRNLNPLLPILEELEKNGVKDVAIVARAFGEQAIRTAMEMTRQGFHVYPINAPYTDQNEVMKDLEAVLGGRYVNYEEMDLKDILMSDVGVAGRIVAKRFNAIFTAKNKDGEDGVAQEKRIEKRIEELKKKIEGEQSDFSRRLLQERIAQLSSGFGIVKVGAISDTERQYKLDKATDAVNAVRAALLEGTVKGAGLALKEISDELPDTYILKKPICSVWDQIKLSAPKDFEVPNWVRDPVRVVRIGLEKACSVAGTLSTIMTVVTSEYEELHCCKNKNEKSTTEETE